MTLQAAAEAVWQAVSPLVPDFTVEVVPEIDSTNSELMRRARAGRVEPVLLVAERQTGGRGRLGRNWQSEPGASLTVSLGLPLAPVSWSGLSLAVGVAAAESLHADVRLKWPNDLWVGDRKLGGILIETGMAPGVAERGDAGPAERYAVVGIGLNIAPRAAEGLSTPPAALQELLPAADAGAALRHLVPPVVAALLAFRDDGFAPFQARFQACDLLRDREVVLSDGTEGTAHGVTDDGSLLVHTAAGMRTVSSAEVSVRPRPT
jgi:BirA family biotin operon repressor/biotin-[acetyl-CoA-carboxylase] ligase